MNILEIIGIITITLISVICFYKLYRKIFGYSYNSCPIDHDTIARYGARRCDVCKTDFT